MQECNYVTVSNFSQYTATFPLIKTSYKRAVDGQKHNSIVISGSSRLVCRAFAFLPRSHANVFNPINPRRKPQAIHTKWSTCACLTASNHWPIFCVMFRLFSSFVLPLPMHLPLTHTHLKGQRIVWGIALCP